MQIGGGSSDPRVSQRERAFREVQEGMLSQADILTTGGFALTNSILGDPT